ncbi:hypothetical protein NL676_013224 [Syzygium grande]|nr:hypothetical protein NL676_013224 [Syzygium grande]
MDEAQNQEEKQRKYEVMLRKTKLTTKTTEMTPERIRPWINKCRRFWPWTTRRRKQRKPAMLGLNAAVVSLVMVPAAPLVATAKEERRSAAADEGGRESSKAKREEFYLHSTSIANVDL